MNLSAMDIIMASSWAGRPILLNGDSSFSMPSVRSIGVVVNVSSDPLIMISTSRIASLSASTRPSQVIYLNGTACDMGVPRVVNMFITAVNMIMNRMGLSPLSVYFTGTPDIMTVSSTNIAMAVNVQNEFTRNITAMNTMDKMILVLGSALWITESPGIYWPIVILVLITTHIPPSDASAARPLRRALYRPCRLCQGISPSASS